MAEVTTVAGKGAETETKRRGTRSVLVDEGNGILLERITKDTIAVLRCGRMESRYQGNDVSTEAIMHHNCGPQPVKETVMVGHDMLRVKFDIEKEVLGTGEAFIFFRTSGKLSFFGILSKIKNGKSDHDIASIAARMPEETLAILFDSVKEDPAILNRLAGAMFPAFIEANMELEMGGRVNLIRDGGHEVGVNESPELAPTPGNRD
jgi:hypothetical protein